MDVGEVKTAADARVGGLGEHQREADIADSLLRRDTISDAGSCARGLVRDARCGRPGNRGHPTDTFMGPVTLTPAVEAPDRLQRMSWLLPLPLLLLDAVDDPN
jgi:hypothetical protein